jgi:NADH-quinone oxidoreductase subunit H
LIVLPVAMLAKSFNLKDIILSQISVWYVLPLLPLAFIFFVCSLAETNRAPFDLPEAEAELVAGYNLEYSGLMFAMFFLGEYSNMLLMSALNVIFFWGGWLPYFSTLIPIQCTLHVLSEHWIICIFAFVVKILIYCHLFILIRATLPRYRYDQLMDLGWKFFLPFTFAFLIIVFVILITKYDLTQEVLFSLNIGGEWIQSSSISVLTNKHNV